MVRPAAPASGHSGLELPPPRSCPTRSRKGGLKDHDPRPAGTGGTAQRGTEGGGDGRDHRGRGGARGHALAHSPVTGSRPASPAGLYSRPSPRCARSAPAFPADGGGCGSGNAFSEPDPTARAARPPRPLPRAPAYRPVPPSGRKYRLLPPQQELT